MKGEKIMPPEFLGNIVVRDADFEGVNPNALNVRGYRFLNLKVYFIYK